MKKNQTILFFLPVIVVLFLIVGIIIFPQEAIKSAKEGLNIWVNVLIPSLLPFIIGANLVVDLKIVDLVGMIINPVTKFIFNVSGKSALVFVISTVLIAKFLNLKHRDWFHFALHLDHSLL